MKKNASPKSGKLAALILLSIAVAILCAATLSACGLFGQTQKNNPQPHEHEYVFHEAVPSTCTETGTYAYYYCEGCDRYFDMSKKEEPPFKTIEGKKPHSYKEVVDNEASCSQYAHKHRECTVCGYRIDDEDFGEKLPHIWNGQESCSVCGTPKPYIVRDGKYYFGQYPQTRETDNGIINVLNGMAGARPSSQNRGKWSSYDYYMGERSGHPAQSNYMWFVDLELNEAKYRGVYIANYRPYFVGETCTPEDTFAYQALNGYVAGEELYWFRFEPIGWRALKEENDKVLLQSDVILDSTQYYREIRATFLSPGVPSFPNNFRRSDIHYFLGQTFYLLAFDELDRQIILKTQIDNDTSTMCIESEALRSDAARYSIDKLSTFVFLLSYKEAIDPAYGFGDGGASAARALKVTDYALSQGARSEDGYGYWWLRSPHVRRNDNSEGQYVSCVQCDGAVDRARVNGTVNGVAPALWLSLYEDDIKAA